MKVNYPLRNRHSHTRLKRIFALVVIFIIGAFFFKLFEGPIVKVISPIWRAENSFSQFLRDKAALISSRLALVEENANLKEKISSLESALAISRQAGERQIPEDQIGVATILARPPETPYDILIVDMAQQSGVKVGSKVSTSEGAPIGVVAEVFGQEAKIKLFSTVKEETHAVLERHSVPVVLVGTGGGNFKIILPRDVAVEKEDRIISLDETSHLLAVVEDIKSQPTDSFKEVLAKSPINIFGLRFVIINH